MVSDYLSHLNHVMMVKNRGCEVQPDEQAAQTVTYIQIVSLFVARLPEKHSDGRSDMKSIKLNVSLNEDSEGTEVLFS